MKALTCTLLVMCVLAIGGLCTGCELPWTQVVAKVCPDCPDPTLDECKDVLLDYGLDAITGNETGDD